MVSDSINPNPNYKSKYNTHTHTRLTKILISICRENKETQQPRYKAIESKYNDVMVRVVVQVVWWRWWCCW